MTVAQSWFGGLVKSGPSLSEMQAYYTENLAKAKAGTYEGKEIKPGVELLDGWTPWTDTGKTTGAEITAAIARAGTTEEGGVGAFNSIIPGDWFDVTAGDTTYRYVCNGRDQYYVEGDATNGKHHYVFVPDKLYPTAMAYAANNSNDWASSDLKKWMEGTFYGSLPEAVRDSIVTLNVPFFPYQGTRQNIASKVFPPSEIEVGKKIYSAETAGGSPANNPFIPLSRSDDTRKRTEANTYYWLRSTDSSNTYFVPIIDPDGTASVYYANRTGGAALPCFNVG